MFNGWVLKMSASGHLQLLRSLTLDRTWIGLMRRRTSRSEDESVFSDLIVLYEYQLVRRKPKLASFVHQ